MLPLQVDTLRSRVQEAAHRIESAESIARESDRRQKQLEAELVVAKQGGGGGGDHSQVMCMLNSRECRNVF